MFLFFSRNLSIAINTVESYHLRRLNSDRLYRRMAAGFQYVIYRIMDLSFNIRIVKKVTRSP
ncbi:hypothetical protein ES332_A04G160100v1 [Gossypium tomentosum]|uniref:Uncharacterized protein n=1 Tax=Gossypium tomentosum TaxID=34277 RepID=A0A5D2R2V1_GOSTO|nr:hypothetical protein ES332_A04G160100v1 [Gossypium tomentosum]